MKLKILYYQIKRDRIYCIYQYNDEYPLMWAASHTSNLIPFLTLSEGERVSNDIDIYVFLSGVQLGWKYEPNSQAVRLREELAREYAIVGQGGYSAYYKNKSASHIKELELQKELLERRY